MTRNSSIDNFSDFTGAYCFGFNGKESDNSTSADSYDFGARILDARIGRWLGVDQKSAFYAPLSAYNYMSNSPLILLDPNGKEIIIYNEKHEPVTFISGSPCLSNDTYVQEVWASLESFLATETDETRKGELTQLYTSPDITLTIEDAHGIGNSGQYVDGAISWNNRTAMFTCDPLPNQSTNQTMNDTGSSTAPKPYAIYPDDPLAVLSPREILEHELRHAVRDLILHTWHDGFGSGGRSEEGKTMSESEKRNGQNRISHRGVGFVVNSSTSEIFNGI